MICHKCGSKVELDEEAAIRAQMDVTDAFAILWKFTNDKGLSYWDYLYDRIDESYNEEAKQLYDEVIKIDPKFQTDYTGTSWWVKECELV